MNLSICKLHSQENLPHPGPANNISPPVEGLSSSPNDFLPNPTRGFLFTTIYCLSSISCLVKYFLFNREYTVSVLCKRGDLRWNIAWARGKSQGHARGIFPRAQAIFHCISWRKSQYRPSQLQLQHWIPGRSILEELILRIATTAGQYGKILPVDWEILES